MNNCKNCGAPLSKDGKCHYCGTIFKPEYAYELPHTIRYDTYTHNVDTLEMSLTVPFETERYKSKEEILNHVKKTISEELSEQLTNYMTIDEYMDPFSMSTKYRGRIKVARLD